MEGSTFSTALYQYLHLDLDIADCDPAERFGDRYLPICGNANELARYSLLRSVFKKTEQEVDGTAESLTLLRFLEANNACKEWKVPLIECPGIGYSISYARTLLREWLEPRCGTELLLSMSGIERFARFGPGQSSGMVKGYPTQFYFKVGDQPLTASSDFLLSWYKQSVRNNPTCEAAEMARKARHGQADGIVGSKLGFVPKSYASRRITTTEPSVNTYFQLGAGVLIESVLRDRLGIDFSLQPERNQRLACEGSISGAFATMDLTQCSDYISQGLVAYMFPKSAKQWFDTLRTRRVDISGLGERELYMTGTMGNGFTFPMQTILLAALVLGVYKTLDITAIPPGPSTDGNYGVFGDDIICLTEAFPLLTKVINTLGLKVNLEKSFACGSFRESCGADYFCGTDVRGVYIHSYRTKQDFLSIFNRLAIWSTRHRIPLPRTLRFIAELLGEDRQCYVPPDESLVSGVILPLPFEERSNWVYERYVPVVSPFHIETWEFIEIERQLNNDKTRGVRRQKWLDTLIRKMDDFGGSLNEPAVVKALLYGAIRRGSIVTRALNPSYKRVVSMTPRWGYTEQPLCRDFGNDEFERWNRLVIEATKASSLP